MRKFSYSKAMNLTGRNGTALLMDQLGEDIKASDVFREGEEVFVEVDQGPDAYQGRHEITTISPDGHPDVLMISPSPDDDAEGSIRKLNKMPLEAETTKGGRSFLITALIISALVFAYTAIKTNA